jgi:hypothetical protein
VTNRYPKRINPSLIVGPVRLVNLDRKTQIPYLIRIPDPNLIPYPAWIIELSFGIQRRTGIRHGIPHV